MNRVRVAKHAKHRREDYHTLKAQRDEWVKAQEEARIVRRIALRSLSLVTATAFSHNPVEYTEAFLKILMRCESSGDFARFIESKTQMNAIDQDDYCLVKLMDIHPDRQREIMESLVHGPSKSSWTYVNQLDESIPRDSPAKQERIQTEWERVSKDIQHQCMEVVMFQSVLQFYFPSPIHSTRDIYILQSTGIGDASRSQGVHTDYDPTLFTETDARGRARIPSYSALFSVMHGTSLLVGKPLQGAEGHGAHEMQVVDIPVGHMIIWRGYMPHAGNRYPEQNVRIHAYLPSCSIPHNKTRLDRA